jgi:diguanylate cyclase (GGDEF)-like protein/PAS domain S-box-containing protein
VQIHGSYDPFLVALSVAVATFASFTGLNLAGRLLAADKSARIWWLIAAAAALGGGIWSMHFVGMLAFKMPMPATYDVRLTLISLLLPILVVGASLHAVGRFGATRGALITAGVLAGFGIVVMHYTGMAAMRMPGIEINFDPALVAASAAIAIVAAAAALWLAFRTTGTGERLAAAAVMGAAISGMHYTGMAAATFTMTDHMSAIVAPVIEPDILALSVASAASILLLLALVTAYFDRKLATLTAHEAAVLRQSEERYRALTENASDIIAIVDEAGEFIYESSSARRILGYRTEDIIGRRLADLVPRERTEAVHALMRQVLEGPGAQATGEIAARHIDGSWRDFEIVAKNLLDEPAIQGIVVNLRDITERKRLMGELERLSETDALTNTLNRRGFLRLADREFQRIRRSGRSVTVVMVDVDHFKEVNDRYGHAAGDMVLAMVATKCKEHIRSVDVLARFGGEEFVILLIDASPTSGHEIVARMHNGIAAARISTIKGEIAVTASFGVATIDPAACDLETALRLADEALYEAKNAGRNCIKIRA